MNWRGRPLTSLRTIIELISATATSTGLTVRAAHDPDWYAKGIRITGYRTRRRPTHTTRLPPRMELHHQRSIKPEVSPNTCSSSLER